MTERSQLVAKKPDVKKDNSVSKSSKTCYSQSMSSPTNYILFLQRTIGNQAVQRLIKSGILQAKLRIGQQGDKYEQEADRVADVVIQMPEPQAASGGALYIQRACPKCEEDELRQQPIEEEEEEMRRQPIEEEKEELQAKASSGHISNVNPDIESQIQSLRGRGQPLSANDRTFFESRFGADFSLVRLHTDAQAIEMARAVNARAFTVGQDVVFGAGQYTPEISEGRKLLAHELTHVVQQVGGTRSYGLFRVPSRFIQRIRVPCGDDNTCEIGHREGDPTGCDRQCRGCIEPGAVGLGIRQFTTHQPPRAFQIWFCPDSTQPLQNQTRRLEDVVRMVRYWVSHERPVFVFGFASRDRELPTYNNRWLAAHRALEMVTYLRHQISTRGLDWLEALARMDLIQPFIDPEHFLDGRYVWIESQRRPPRQPSDRPRQHFLCRGPNPVDSFTEECEKRRLFGFTGHCTWCRGTYPRSNYNCETDICAENEIRQRPGEPTIFTYPLCNLFYSFGVSDERQGRRDEEKYRQGERTELMFNCCRCYKLGVDDQRRQGR